jgi:integrase
MVATLPAGDHTDPAVPGLQLRVREKRAGTSRTWLLRYRWGEEWVRIVLGHAPGMSLSEARDRAHELRKAIDNGIDPRRARPRRRQSPTALPLSSATAGRGSRNSIEYLVSEFMERHVRPHRKRPEYAQAILERNVLPVWRGRDARSIEPAEVLDLLDGIVDRGSKVMANRTAALLGQMFKFGIHRRIVTSTPVQLLYRPGGKEKPRERALSDGELQAFLADPTACTRYERLAHAMLILLLTGQRRGEIVLARWSEIDYDAQTWTIPDENSKNGRGHVVPLTDWTVQEFEALQRLSKRSAWVLPANGGEQHLDPKQLTRSVAKCQERFQKQGLEPFTLHDLRRTCRTGLARLKIEPHIAERVLNHVQERIPGTYDRHKYLDEKRDALEKWAAHLKKLREGTRRSRI